jgi:NADH-quinone oxidoreductase subunit J
METFVFLISAAIILGGAIRVVISTNPVHAALSLVATLFGIAVLFVAQDAHFLAAVQVIVYAGAIVVLFLFVIMLLGVDRAEDLSTDPIAGQRPLAAIAGIGVLGAALVTLFLTRDETNEIATGSRSLLGRLSDSTTPDINKLGEALFTDYLYAFEITSILLVIAVVGAVVLARRLPKSGEEVERTWK